jgi:outer membrane lipoprotein-sorting protein
MRFLLTIAAFVLAAAPVRAQDAEGMLDRASAAHLALKTLKVAFEQVIQNPLTGSSVTARGEMLQKGPHLLAIHFSQPKGDQIIADGQNLWIFLPSTTPGQVFRVSLGGAQANAVAGSVDVLSQFFNDPRKRFDVKDAGMAPIDGKDARALILTPKKGVDAPFAKAVVWVDAKSAYVRQFETTDASGLVRTVKVTKFGPNAKVNDTEFRFVVPAGVRVVEQPGM